MKHLLAFISNIKKQLPAMVAVLVLAVPMVLTAAPRTSAEALAAVGSDTAVADPIRKCGASPADKDGSRWGRYFRVNGVNIRKSPSTNSRICAQGQKSHVVDYHCWTRGSDGYTWTYLRDATTHYAGWVRDNLLTNRGSLVHC